MIRLPASLVEGLVYPLLLLLIGGAVAFYNRTSNQNAIQRYKDNHPDVDSDDAHTEALIDELRRQIAEQREQINDLRQEVSDERAARQRSEARSQQLIADLNEKVSSAETRLGIARAQIKSLQDKETS